MRLAVHPFFLGGSLVFFALLLRTSAAEHFGPTGRSSQQAVLAIVGGRIITQTDAGVVEGTLLIEAGKIVAVGANVEIPEGARRIEATGMTVTPGLIDARSTLRVTDAGRREGAADGRLNVLDAIDLYDEDWLEVARHGVTAVYVQPASSGTLGGAGAVIQLGPGPSLDELVVENAVAVQAAIGTGSAATNVLQRRQQFESIQKALKAAKEYGEAWEKYRAAKKKEEEKKEEAKKDKDETDDEKSAEAEGNQQPDADEKQDDKENDEDEADKAKKPAKPKRDPAKELLLRAIKQDIPVRFEVHGPHAVRFALELIDEFKLRGIIEGLSYQGALEEGLDRRRVPLVLGPMLGDPPSSRVRRTDDSQTWPLPLVSDEAVWALGTDGSVGRDSRLLRAHAAVAVARGFDPDHVLAAMTSHAAEVLGVADRLGSLEVGKQADLSVFAGDPLDPSVPVLATIVRGEVVYENGPLEADRNADLADTNDGRIEVAPTNDTAELPATLPATFALKSRYVLTDSGTWQPMTVVVEQGRITSANSQAEVRADVSMFDLGEAAVTPGLVTAQSSLGRGADIDEIAEADASNIRALDVFDPTGTAARRFREAGFTTALLAPEGRNVLAGSCAVIRLCPDDAAVIAEAGQKIVLAPSARRQERYPASLAGQIEFAEAFLGGSPPQTDLFLSDALRAQILAQRRARLDALRSGDRPVFFAAVDSAEVAAALRMIERFELRGVLVGPDDIGRVVPELVRLNVAIVARPWRSTDYDRYLDGLVAAARAGVPIAFGLGTAEEIRVTAAMAAGRGMPRAAALEALCSGAARLLGADGKVGSVSAGCGADLVIWSGSPLDLRAKVLRVLMAAKTKQKGDAYVVR